MPNFELRVNGGSQRVTADPEMPLLWVLRDRLHLLGTKYGCGVGVCGACTVHVSGRAVRACIVTVAEAAGREVTTIEGLRDKGSDRVKQAWLDERVAQCGYCQPGMIMAAAALLAEKPNPSDAEVDAAITNVCRCGTYTRVRAAIARASAR
ncbi:MAG TPA: (2Fe-2S)-binding protein [Allosphingosinicella sp.]|uniref:(2Fe-2S)-binding protein n=1 Tax=Allosphingosinicella sp. TaxID=2823234 RepID=UPI002ED781D9